jgi:hypothetical protein
VTSSANFPPELAAYELKRRSVADADRATVEAPKATRALEMYYFGLLAFSLCTPDAETVFKANQADNLVNWEADSERLAYRMEEMKLELTARIMASDAVHPTTGKAQDWSAAMELCLQTLQPNPKRRPQSIKELRTKCPRFFKPESADDLPDTKQAVSQGRSARALDFHRTIASAAGADDGGEAAVQAVRTMLADGDVDYNLPMPSQARSSDSMTQPIRPLHRAVQTGSVAMVKLFVDDEIHPKALSAAFNMRTEFGFTVLHWACVFNHAPMVELLLDRPLEQQCDTSATNYRGKTAWDVAEAVKAQAALKVLETFADPSHCHANPGLCKEKERRERRPEVDETFRDDIELDMLRFIFWCIDMYDNWELLAEGAFGFVYRVTGILSIEINGRHFDEAAVKVAKAGGVEELKSEVEGLRELSHVNVVQILGMIYGVPPNGTEPTYMMALEWCDSQDLEHLVLDKKKYPDSIYTKEAALALATGVACGMTYIHERGILHLDLKLVSVCTDRQS